jgi:hypothetical protein
MDTYRQSLRTGRTLVIRTSQSDNIGPPLRKAYRQRSNSVGQCANMSNEESIIAIAFNIDP